MKKGPNPKFFMMLTGVTLLVGSGLSYMQYSSMEEAAAKVEVLRKEQRDENQLNQSLQESTVKLQETSEKLAHLEKNIPEFAYVPTLLKELEKTGKENGIEVLGVRPVAGVAPTAKDKDKPAKKKAYTELNIQMTGRGNYRSVLNFVKAMEQFPKIVAARTLSMTPKTDPRWTGTTMLEVSMEFRTYLFPTEDPAAAKTAKTAYLQEGAKRNEG